MNMLEIQPHLSNLQFELLKLYASGVSDEELIDIKHLLSKYFLRKAVSQADKIIAQKGYTQRDFDNWLNQ
jgi:hypothetical protein